MKYYVDIKLLPDPEFAPTLIMNILYAKLHRELVQLGEKNIGVSFPEYDINLRRFGSILRLHGDSKNLQCLMDSEWLMRMRDHIHLGQIQLVPDAVEYCIVRRVQAKSSVDRIRRRLMRRHNVDEIEARATIPATVRERLNLPFISLKSTSTDQAFRLFIRQEKTDRSPQAGEFNAYGLSKVATLPLF